MPIRLLDHFCFGSQGNTVIAGNWEKIQPWIIFYNILILYYHKVVEVLSKHAGLWITRDKEIMYSQATHINFICPMRFDNFPLDTQVKSSHIRKINEKQNSRSASSKLDHIRMKCQRWLSLSQTKFRGKEALSRVISSYCLFETFVLLLLPVKCSFYYVSYNYKITTHHINEGVTTWCSHQ